MGFVDVCSGGASESLSESWSGRVVWGVWFAASNGGSSSCLEDLVVTFC